MEWITAACQRGKGTQLLRHLLHAPKGARLYVGVDLAVGTKERNDLTSIATVMVHANGDRDRVSPCCESADERRDVGAHAAAELSQLLGENQDAEPLAAAGHGRTHAGGPMRPRSASMVPRTTAPAAPGVPWKRPRNASRVPICSRGYSGCWRGCR